VIEVIRTAAKAVQGAAATA